MVKSVPIVQEIYKTMLQDAELAFDTIVASCSDKASSSPSLSSSLSASDSSDDDDENVDADATIARTTMTPGGSRRGLAKLRSSVEHAETSLIFNLCIFAELGNTKNNLITVNIKNSNKIVKCIFNLLIFCRFQRLLIV